MKKQKMPAPTGGVCRHFQKGNCHFGKKCRFLHLEPAASGTKKATKASPEMEVPPSSPQLKKRHDWHPHIFCSDIVGVITEFYGCGNFFEPVPTPLMLVCSTWLQGVANCYPSKCLNQVQWPLIALRVRQSPSIRGTRVLTNKGLAELSSCTHLKKLEFRSCAHMAHKGWSHLLGIPHLEHLVLADVTYKKIATILNRMVNLRHLEWNGLNMDMIGKLGSLTKLQTLKGRLDHRAEKEKWPPFLFPSLERLELRDIRLRAALFQRIRPLRNLTSLILVGNITEMTEEDLEYFQSLTSLQLLEISASSNSPCNYTVYTLQGLESFATLKSVTLSGLAQLADTGLSCLKSMHSLEELHLTKCHGLAKKGLRNISKLVGLRTLELGNCKISDEHIDQVVELKNLEHLNLRSNSGITRIGAKRLSSLASLRSLDLSFGACAANDDDDDELVNAFSKTVDLRIVEIDQQELSPYDSYDDWDEEGEYDDGFHDYDDHFDEEYDQYDDLTY